MRLALLLLVAISAFGGDLSSNCYGCTDLQPAISIGDQVSNLLPHGYACTSGIPPSCTALGQQPQAERALEDNVKDILGGPSIAIKDGTLLCSDGSCVVFRVNGAEALEIHPALDKSLLAAVRIYRYKLARSEAPVDAAASTCADGEAQVGDACDVQDSGLLFMLGSTR